MGYGQKPLRTEALGQKVIDHKQQRWHEPVLCRSCIHKEKHIKDNNLLGMYPV